MATAHEMFEKGLTANDMDSGSDKGRTQEIDTVERGPEVVTSKSRVFEPPELVKAMSPEQRAAAEKKLKAKIDLRLMPMIVLMYIMNYLDRVSGCCCQFLRAGVLILLEQHRGC